MNRGAYLLQRTGATAESIGAACGVSAASGGYWRSGKKKPAADKRKALLDVYGVPLEAWDEPEDGPSNLVGKTDTAPTTAVEKGEPPYFPPVITTASPPGMGAAARADYLDRELQKILSILSADKNTTALERMKALSLAAQIEDRIATLRGEKELTNMRIVNLPFWRRICERSADTLAKWPEAARAFAAMVRELEQEAHASVSPAKVA